MSRKSTSIQIRGVLTLTAPAHQKSPDGGSEGLAPQMKTGVFFEGKRLEVPYITANSVRALIRREASAIFEHELRRRGEQLSRNVYLSMRRGSYARSGMEAGGGSYPQLIAASAHPFVGVFGGGAPMYPSRMRLDRDLMPMISATRALLPQSHASRCIDAHPFQLLTKGLIASRDDFENPPEEGLIIDAAQEHAQHMAAKHAQNALKREQKADATAAKSEKAKTDDLNTYTEVECVAPGTPLFFSMSLSNVSESQIGLVFSAIQAWANKNQLGGGSIRGRGSFMASLQVYCGAQEIIGNLLEGDAGLYALSPQAAPYLAALNLALAGDAASAATLGALYPTVIKNDEGGKKPKGKSKGAAQGAAEPETTTEEIA